MLSAEENAMLTQTDPDTPMGELFRRFWMPAMLADELPGADCPPVRLRLTGGKSGGFSRQRRQCRRSRRLLPASRRAPVLWPQ